jgi:RNA 2',3'-cyclic 3'-phosphodiesterase
MAPQEHSLRLFIALPIPELVKAELTRAQVELRRVAPGDGVRWVKAEQMHLTLSFLGQVESGRVEAVIAAARDACTGLAAFPLRAQEAGFFPEARRPRVVWTGLHDETGALAALQRTVVQAVGKFAEKAEDRPFRPHLTLGRVKSLRPAEARALAEAVAALSHRSFGEWTADKLAVMRSELHPSGSRYACLAEIPLRSREP